MKKIWATIVKEWTLTRRDVAGIMLLFLMPALLIVVMAMVQDAPFKDYQERSFELLIVDNDNTNITQQIKNGLASSGNFHIIDTIDNRQVSEIQLKNLLQNGDYKVGIVIPKGASAEIVNAANTVANNVTQSNGLPTRTARDSNKIRMYFDPVSKPTFRMSVSFALDKLITVSSTGILVDRFTKMNNTEDSETRSVDFKTIFSSIGIEERMLGEEIVSNSHANSVQHNVPAWAIFGMFFIVIPICSHLIRERQEGSALRIELIPNARKMVALGKILFYTIVCTMQFVVMFCVGLWLLPLLGLPALHLGPNAWVLLVAAISIAIAATSYGYFIGSVFRTANQAMPFGAISVVILSALGGIWVPVDIFSPALQKLAMLSPLYWGLDSINTVTLRNGGVADIAPNVTVLMVFSATLWGISTVKNKKRQISIQ